MADKTYLRYRAFIEGCDLKFNGSFQNKRTDAIKEAIDYALAEGIIVVTEVHVKRRMKAEYEEVDAAPEEKF